MFLLEVYIDSAGGPLSGPETPFALGLRAEMSPEYEELWTT